MNNVIQVILYYVHQKDICMVGFAGGNGVDCPLFHCVYFIISIALSSRFVQYEEERNYKRINAMYNARM